MKRGILTGMRGIYPEGDNFLVLTGRLQGDNLMRITHHDDEELVSVLYHMVSGVIFTPTLHMYNLRYVIPQHEISLWI